MFSRALLISVFFCYFCLRRVSWVVVGGACEFSPWFVFVACQVHCSLRCTFNAREFRILHVNCSHASRYCDACLVWSRSPTKNSSNCETSALVHFVPVDISHSTGVLCLTVEFVCVVFFGCVAHLNSFLLFSLAACIMSRCWGCLWIFSLVLVFVAREFYCYLRCMF